MASARAHTHMPSQPPAPHQAFLLKRLLERDPFLKPHVKVLKRRIQRIQDTENRLTRGRMRLSDFAAGHEYFGLHLRGSEWIFREWAPNAVAVFLVGVMTGWQEQRDFALEKVKAEGVWEIRLPAVAMAHGDLYRLRIHWPGGAGDRIPVYARRVVQDPDTLIFNAQVWLPPTPFAWTCTGFKPPSGAPFIYETHVGIAQEEARVGTYTEFRDKILPRIVAAGYNTLQLMAIQQHPYYGSFGYHVSNFFAASSRFGTPEALKALIDAAHLCGLRVLIDLVHSHAVSNEVEGLGRFDGTPYQFFHEGPRGIHQAWDSRCFDYGKPQVLHFLLSNCRFWLDEYRLDGFRFDGITSMLYTHHGLNRVFNSYAPYFDDSVDEDAIAYLALANRLIHEVKPDSLTIAEDVSGMPGLTVPDSEGGYGFDYRFAMGVPDGWVRLVKEVRDEDWSMGHLFHELTNRRRDEQSISYAESHDQALVGDQTLIFRLIGAAMYDRMQVGDNDSAVDRGMALHKIIRFVTLVTAGNGYLNFMGNEFGHPEWIDFPREGNNWSYHYARRQWSLVDNSRLKYRFLADFDRDLLALAQNFRLLDLPGPTLLWEHNEDSVLAMERGGLVFVFNFHPTRSYTDYRFNAPPGKYRIALDSDSPSYGGHGRLQPDEQHLTLLPPMAPNTEDQPHQLILYLPSRTALALAPVP